MIKKLLLIIVLSLCFACKGEKCCFHQDNIIEFEDLFQVKESSYFVMFYLDSCLACRNTKLFLMAKCKTIKENIYYVDFLKCQFTSSSDKQDNVGKGAIEEIFIKSVPTTIYISNKIITREIIGYKELINSDNFFIQS